MSVCARTNGGKRALAHSLQQGIAAIVMKALIGGTSATQKAQPVRPHLCITNVMMRHNFGF